MRPSQPPIVLSISGHDPSGGAGIQADIETLSSLDCLPVTAVTCLTVQDSRNILSITPVAAELVLQQAEIILADYPVKAIKIGLLGDSETARRVGNLLTTHCELPVILDPVLAAGGGTDLAGEALIEEIVSSILPRTTIITPNSIEAQRLGGKSQLEACADQLIKAGCDAVLITGTHEESKEVINTLYRPGSAAVSQSWQRLPESYHGSGCTLASAIAAFLVNGNSLEDAVALAQAYTWNALSRGWRPGSGQYIPDRLHPLK